MPSLGIIRGFGEGYIVTGCIIRLIKAINKRFRSHITYEEIPCGNYIEHGREIPEEIAENIKEYDCILSGDFASDTNPISYTEGDIAYALSANIEYTYVSMADTDICIASYFDGGFKMRDGKNTREGSSETRVCSAYTALNIVKDVSRLAEKRRRRLAFVTDADNEYCADMFSNSFESFTMPMSNFKMVKYTSGEICHDILCDIAAFDVIFASKAFTETTLGVFRFLMKDKYASFKKYNSEKPFYTVKAAETNSASGDYTPSLYSYITAFSELLKAEFNMEKEAVSLQRALLDAMEFASFESGEEFTDKVIELLQRPVKTKYSKAPEKSRYIK
ncbi:MAG: hypothetical protein IJO83_00395 [Clostridia bacterium]|nr:hypothetical protein [Clostridia bacterium]